MNNYTENKMLFLIKNKHATLQVFENYCTIEYKRDIWSFIFSGKFFSGQKTIYYRDITAVQLRRIGWIFSGYLKFEYPGAPTFSRYFNLFTDSAMTFTDEHSKQMELIYSYIQKRILEIQASNLNVTYNTKANDDIGTKPKEFENPKIEYNTEAESQTKDNVISENNDISSKIEEIEKQQIERLEHLSKFKAKNKKILKPCIIWLCVVIAICIALTIISLVLIPFGGIGIAALAWLIPNIFSTCIAFIWMLPTLIVGIKNPTKEKHIWKIISLVGHIMCIVGCNLVLPFGSATALFFLIMSRKVKLAD